MWRRADRHEVELAELELPAVDGRLLQVAGVDVRQAGAHVVARGADLGGRRARRTRRGLLLVVLLVPILDAYGGG